MLNKFLPFLIVCALLGGLFILFMGLMAMDFHISQRPLLAIAGSMLFSAGLIALSIHANRSK